MGKLTEISDNTWHATNELGGNGEPKKVAVCVWQWELKTERGDI